MALGRLAEPGDPRFADLVAELGAVALLDSLIGQRDLGGVLADIAGRVETMGPQRDLEQAERLGHPLRDPLRRRVARQLDDLAGVEPLQDRGGVPLGLWVKGPLRLDELAGSVAVVGSRSATTYGADVAADLAAVVARAGHAVVSGAAFGIDQAAHRGALAAGGRTVAVLACGVDRAYPMAHKRLLDHLGAEGAVVSEVPTGCSPTRLRFLARNRLIAALTRGTVVVEAAVRSGALNTANWAGRLNRTADGRPGAGDQRTVAGGAPADPGRGGDAGDQRRGGARAGGRGGGAPRGGAPCPRAATRPALAARPAGPGRRPGRHAGPGPTRSPGRRVWGCSRSGRP